MLNSFHLLLAVFWILYASLHSVMASVWFKYYMQSVTRGWFRYYRLFYSIVAAVTLLLLLIYQFSHASPLLFKPVLPLYFISIPLLIGGLVVMAVCIKKYFINLSGIDVLIKKEHNAVLETGGLHAYMRHPLYSGTLLFVWSLFLMFPLMSNFIACLAITVYTCIGIRMEEKKLLIEFGEAYRSYASTVPMLIPSLGKK
jgi:protein-S-isoprenylcysteine O-methyltransferase Ste14